MCGFVPVTWDSPRGLQRMGVGIYATGYKTGLEESDSPYRSTLMIRVAGEGMETQSVGRAPCIGMRLRQLSAVA